MVFAMLMMAQLQLWDSVMTDVFVRGGLAREANGLMANIIHGGDFVLFKLVSVVVLALALWCIYRRVPRLAIYTAAGISVFYLGVITWNFLIIFANLI